MPVDVFSACFEVCLVCFDSLCVPESLKGEPFWTKKGEGSAKNVLFQFCPWTNWSAKTHVVSPFGVCFLDCWDTPCMSRNRLEGLKRHRNVPQVQRMRQEDQQVIGNDTKNDPKVASRGTKLCQNAKKKRLQLGPSTKS